LRGKLQENSIKMEIRGKIIAILPPQGGISGRTGNPWKKQEYILEIQDKFPRKVCFQIFGEDRITQAAIREGEELTVHIDIDSQEYQGRWFTRVSAWKVERGAIVAPVAEQYATSSAQGDVPASTSEPPSYPPPIDSKDNDLPF
jgi:hypothetical protein